MTNTDATFKKITNSDIYQILQEVRDEVKKTNGRVTRAEQRLDDIKEHLSDEKAGTEKRFKQEKQEVEQKFNKVWAVVGGIISAFLVALFWITERLF